MKQMKQAHDNRFSLRLSDLTRSEINSRKIMKEKLMTINRKKMKVSIIRVHVPENWTSLFFAPMFFVEFENEKGEVFKSIKGSLSLEKYYSAIVYSDLKYLSGLLKQSKKNKHGRH